MQEVRNNLKFRFMMSKTIDSGTYMAASIIIIFSCVGLLRKLYCF